MGKKVKVDKVYAHQIKSDNFQLFVDAGLEDWYNHFSQQFKYARAWANTGQFTPQEAKAWAKIVDGRPYKAVEFLDNGFTPETAAPWCKNTLYKPAHCAELVKQGRTPRSIVHPRPQRTR